MKNYTTIQILSMILVKIYCGFVQDSYLTISMGAISSFSNNRYDPRFMISDSTTGTSYVLAINYNTIWMLKNISGLGYEMIVERSYQPSTYVERSMYFKYLDVLLYNENMTIVSNFTTSGQTILLGENQNEVIMANWVGTPTVFQAIFINNNTVKWSYTIPYYTCWGYDIQNSTIISLLFPAIADGTILLDVRTIVNSNSTSILNIQNILCSDVSRAMYKGGKDYYAIYNGSQL